MAGTRQKYRKKGRVGGQMKQQRVIKTERRYREKEEDPVQP